MSQVVAPLIWRQPDALHSSRPALPWDPVHQNLILNTILNEKRKYEADLKEWAFVRNIYPKREQGCFREPARDVNWSCHWHQTLNCSGIGCHLG